MERQLILTADGSHSVSIPELNVTYHSVHGAVQESMHVFIEAGLRYWSGRSNHPGQCNILEMGFGTGLNAFMTLAEAAQKEISIHYTSIELFPLNKEEYQLLNYPEALNENEKKSAFENMHNSEWEKDVLISSHFTLFKTNQSLIGFTNERLFDIVYFDAFAPTAQRGTRSPGNQW